MNAASLLWETWRDGRTIETLPDDLRPATLEQGWAIQRDLDELAGRAVGWKIAATTAAGQAAIGADGPHVGRLYERCLVASPARLDAGRMTMRVIEAEFAFRLSRDLAPEAARLSAPKLRDAISELVPAVEIPDTRFTDFLAVGLPSMVADGLCAGHLVLGEPTRSWTPDGLRLHEVTMHRDGGLVATGRGEDVLGGPFEALLWAVHQLHDRGIVLRAGEVMTTGACTPPQLVVDGAGFSAGFGRHGSVEVAFTGVEAT